MQAIRLAGFGIIAAAALGATGCCGPWACGPAHLSGGCATGCGECYVDPWINEPASCCDPCGNHVGGGRCGQCRPVFGGVASLWGYRYDGGCCDGCSDCGPVGCDGCADPGCGCHGGPATMRDGGMMIEGVPTPVPMNESIIEGPSIMEGPSIIEGEARTMRSNPPARRKQIFRDRGPVVTRSPRGRF